MGRGAQAQTRQLTDQQLANVNGLNQQFLGQQQQTGNLLLPQYQSILNNPGLSPADKAAVTGQSQGSLASAFGSTFVWALVLIGALAIGRLAVGRLTIRKARFGALEVDELTVRKLRVVENEGPRS